MRQVEEYLADQQAIDAAERARLQEYLSASSARQEALPSQSFALGGYLDAHAVPVPVPDAVSLLSEGVRLLAVPEDDEEEIDTHSCADSGCAGEHTHAYYDDDYETGHRSPYAGTPSYAHDTCYEGIDYSRMPDSD